ncbi:hypothetical protein OG219_01010 [Streptomyces sp. NBC_00038]|nr:hypothetical protein [Streptomyces sp. NBC_00038]
MWRQETGSSPHQWLVTARPNNARELLAATDLSVERIAARSGLGSGSSMRALRRHSRYHSHGIPSRLSAVEGLVWVDPGARDGCQGRGGGGTSASADPRSSEWRECCDGCHTCHCRGDSSDV